MSLRVVLPRRGRTVHLLDPDYSVGAPSPFTGPGRRPKPRGESVALCGVGIWDNGAGSSQIITVTAALDDPSLTAPAPGTWCRACLGHLVSAIGLERHVIEHALRLYPGRYPR